MYEIIFVCLLVCLYIILVVVFLWLIFGKENGTDPKKKMAGPVPIGPPGPVPGPGPIGPPGPGPVGPPGPGPVIPREPPGPMSEKGFDFKKLKLSRFDETKDYYYCKKVENVETILQKKSETSWVVVCAVWGLGSVIYYELSGCLENGPVRFCDAEGNNLSVGCNRGGGAFEGPVFIGKQSVEEYLKRIECKKSFLVLEELEFTEKFTDKFREENENLQFYESKTPNTIHLRFSGQSLKAQKLDIILVGHESGYVNVDGWQETTFIRG